MNIKEIFVLSFDALKERKVKSILTIIMVMVGSSLMVAVGGISAGFGGFFNKQLSNLAANIIFINPAQVQQGGGGPAVGPPPTPKITLNAAVENRLKSLPFVDDVIPSYQAQVILESQGDSKEYQVFSMDPQKLTVTFSYAGICRRIDCTDKMIPLPLLFLMIWPILLERTLHF